MLELILVVKARGGKIGTQDGVEVAGREGMATSDKRISNPCVEGIPKL